MVRTRKIWQSSMARKPIEENEIQQDADNEIDEAIVASEKLPEVKPVETRRSSQSKTDVQLSMDPSIQQDEEKNEAAEDQ
jgi:hypothetical protein